MDSDDLEEGTSLHGHVCLPDDLTTSLAYKCSDRDEQRVFIAMHLTVLSAALCAGLPGVLPHSTP